jgi:hypothetical protein
MQFIFAQIRSQDSNKILARLEFCEQTSCENGKKVQFWQTLLFEYIMTFATVIFEV